MVCRKENTSVLERDPIGDLYEDLDGAKLVKKVETDGEVVGIIIWRGGHGLHLYDLLCKEIDMRNIGDFKYNSATPEEAEKGIDEWILEIREETDRKDE